jgi:hypothetical protein
MPDQPTGKHVTYPFPNTYSAFEGTGVEEHLEHVVVGLARFLECGCAIAAGSQLIIGDLPADSGDLCHRILERGERNVERPRVGALGALGLDRADEAM